MREKGGRGIIPKDKKWVKRGGGGGDSEMNTCVQTMHEKRVCNWILTPDG